MLNLESRLKVVDFIIEYGVEMPLLNRLVDTPQEPAWHGEGDVHVHTDMVLSEVYDMIDSGKYSLNDSEIRVLIFSALLHDYAKPVTTKTVVIENVERIGAPYHEKVGASLLCHCKRPEELDAEEWHQVLQIIAHHQKPKKLVKKEMGMGAYLEIFMQVKNAKILYLLELADMRGRICEDQELQILYQEMYYENHLAFFGTHLLEEYIEEQKEQISLVQSDFEADRFFLDLALADVRSGDIHSVTGAMRKPYAITRPHQCVVMCGIAGAGKSTYIKSRYIDHGFFVISLDEIRSTIKNRGNQSNNDEVVRIATERLRECLRRGEDVVWDATGYRSDFRTKVLNLAKKYGAHTQVTALIVNKDELHSRNKKRDHKVLSTVIEDQVRKFEFPDLSEADSIIWTYEGQRVS